MGVKRKKKRGAMLYIPYDYEKAYSKAIDNLHEWFVEQMLRSGRKAVYALKEIKAGTQFEIEIYPQFKKMDEVPEEGRCAKRDNGAAQRNLNDKNSRKYVERLINTNFGSRDIWLTLTYDNAHLPPDGDIDTAVKDMRRYIERINYHRKKRGLTKARYIYVTEYDPEAEIRWHHHLIMDGDMEMDVVEGLWKHGRRNQVRRLEIDKDGLSGMANYIVKEKERLKYEKRWHSSKNLKKPEMKVVHSKKPVSGGRCESIGKYVGQMVRDQNKIPDVMKRWYKDYKFSAAEVYYNEFNCMFYIHVRMHEKTLEDTDFAEPDKGVCPWE